jgi:release factor glutamine methyltransferase
MSDPVSIQKAVTNATARLQEISESARLDAELLLARAIDMPRSYLFAHPEETLDDAALGRLEQTLARRLAGEPMAYITGVKEFWSMELLVTPATLVPRPETELLVDIALREIPRKAEWQLLDLGTGSGAIAMAIGSARCARLPQSTSARTRCGLRRPTPTTCRPAMSNSCTATGPSPWLAGNSG